MTIPEKESVNIWRVSAFSDLELMRARYIRQRFSRHAHERFALGVIESGALGFYYRGSNVVAPAGAINLANPDEPNTGHAAVKTGWAYRMFYFDAERLREAAAQTTDRACAVPRFAKGVIQDQDLAGRIRGFHQALERGCFSRLEAQTRFMDILLTLIHRHADERLSPRSTGYEGRAVRRVRDYIHAHFADDISIDQLASIASLSPYHFMRVFSRQVGLPPHSYLIQIRIRRSKVMLRAGQNPAMVAQSVGFFDQSHLTRHFKRMTGLTPAKYRRIVQEIR